MAPAKAVNQQRRNIAGLPILRIILVQGDMVAVVQSDKVLLSPVTQLAAGPIHARNSLAVASSQKGMRLMRCSREQISIDVSFTVARSERFAKANINFTAVTFFR